MAEEAAGDGQAPARPGYLPAAEFERIRRSVPLVCVDLLPFRRAPGGPEVLLIERRQRSERRGWALVGGRVLLDEPIAGAAERHLRETLGETIEARPRSWAHPDEVAEYRRGDRPEEGGTFDPDRHSVALNFCVELLGEPVAGGEALSVRWFAADALPGSEQIVFGQHGLIGRLVSSVPR